MDMLLQLNHLPKPVQDVLIGATGNFLAGLALEITTRILDTVGYQVRKRFHTEPQKQALTQAMAEALTYTIQGLTKEPEMMIHLLEIFNKWTEQESVAGELSQIVDPRPNVELDLDLLRNEFETLEYAPDLLGLTITFEDVVARFVHAFYDAAALQPELQGQIEIGLLRGIVEHTELQLSQNKKQTDLLEKIEGHLTTNLTKQKQRYLERIVRQFEYLPLRGVDFRSADASMGSNERLRVSDVYIALDTTSREEQEQDDLLSTRDEAGPLTALRAVTTQPRLVLTGDPGSGKSTFINYLAFCLANRELELDETWSERLAYWPVDKVVQLPVPVVLSEVASWLQRTQPHQRKTGLFHAWLDYWLAEMGMLPFHDLLCEHLSDGTAILLLDGLDEVPFIEDELAQIREMLEDLPLAYPKTHMVVTCRVLSYQDERWQLDAAWSSFELAKLNEEQIDGFICSWYNQLAALRVVQNAELASAKLSNAVRNLNLFQLARSPLLLTVMALVHTHKGELPTARAVLYEDVVDLLLWRWEATKLDEQNKTKTGWRELLYGAGLNDIDLKQVLWQLAFYAHDQNHADTEQDNTVGIAELEILNALRVLHPNHSWDWAASLVHIMKLRAGLLLEKKPNVYHFPHRTFQEYLAGCYLSGQPDFTEKVIELAKRGPFWRDVILLAVGRLVHLNGDIAKPLVLVSELCPEDAPELEDTAGWRNVWLASSCLCEIGLNRLARRRLGPLLIERARQQLETLVTHDQLEPRERAEAGSILSTIGDPRKFDEMVLVSGGDFIMGSTNAQVEIAHEQARKVYGEKLTQDWFINEKPSHVVSVATFRISKYPVTNEQYAEFVAATQYKSPPHWRSATPPLELRNHPVVYVNWHDAMAYCRWLSKIRGKEFCLPTEAEWEKAAKGIDGGVYPWSGEFIPKYCNMAETGVSQTSPVGIFTEGFSPYGCADMVGNVWEWCSSLRLEYPYQVNDGREEKSANGPRLLRGGAFNEGEYHVRCAYRAIYAPQERREHVGFRIVNHETPKES